MAKRKFITERQFNERYRIGMGLEGVTVYDKKTGKEIKSYSADLSVENLDRILTQIGFDFNIVQYINWNQGGN